MTCSQAIRDCGAKGLRRSTEARRRRRWPKAVGYGCSLPFRVNPSRDLAVTDVAPSGLAEARRGRDAARRRTASDEDPAPHRLAHESAPHGVDDPPVHPRFRLLSFKPRGQQPRSLDEALRLPADRIGGVDPALLNLLASEDLPGFGTISVERAMERLDAWAAHALAMAEAHRAVFDRNPGRFENSLPLWLVLGLQRTLHREFGVHYNPRRVNAPADWREDRDLFIHGALGPWRTGTCASLPVLFLAVGHRMGLPLRLVRAPGHLFCRWDAPRHPDPAMRARFNIEYGGEQIACHSDAYYHRWPHPLPAAVIAQAERNDPRAPYLVSLQPNQEAAIAIGHRATVIAAQGRDLWANLLYRQAHRLDPAYGGYRQFARRIVQRRAQALLLEHGLDVDQVRGWLRENRDDTFGADAIARAMHNDADPRRAPMLPGVTARLNAGGPRVPRPPDLMARLTAVLNAAVAGTSEAPDLSLLAPIPPEPESTPDAPRQDLDAPFEMFRKAVPADPSG